MNLRKARQEAFEAEEVKRRKAFEARAEDAAAHAATADAGGDEQAAKLAVAAMAEAAAAMAAAAEEERVAALEAGEQALSSPSFYFIFYFSVLVMGEVVPAPRGSTRLCTSPSLLFNCALSTLLFN